MTKKKTQHPVYFISFTHGSPGIRQEENIEVNLTDVECITDIKQIKSIEHHLSEQKNFVNPKVINFVFLRKS